MTLDHIKNQIQKKASQLGKYFKCPFCSGGAFTQFDLEVKMYTWFCATCQSKGNLRDLNQTVIGAETGDLNPRQTE